MTQDQYHDKALQQPPTIPPSDLGVRRTSRRAMLRGAVAFAGAGLVSSGLAEAAPPQPLRRVSGDTASGPSLARGGKTPITLMIDDGGPVDAMYYMHPGYDTPLLPPVDFYQQVAETLERFELHGKMTVLPMPSCLGRIDQTLKKVPQEHLEAFLQVVRTRIAPRFDITPEFLTHLFSYNLHATSADLNQGGGYSHLFEDHWISQAQPSEVAAYFSLAYKILSNVGIPSPGMTSPWMSGIDCESKYAQALSEAQWTAFKRANTWYFLHDTGWGSPQSLMFGYQSPRRSHTVVSIPANFPDLFWSMDTPRSDRAVFIRNNIDRVLSPDGRSGRLRDLMESGHPLTLLTHWQSLWTQGTRLGLEGLATLMARIQKETGNSLEWVTCSELADRYRTASLTAA